MKRDRIFEWQKRGDLIEAMGVLTSTFHLAVAAGRPIEGYYIERRPVRPGEVAHKLVRYVYRARRER